MNTGLRTAAWSAEGDAVCVVSVGPPYQLQCLEQDTLRELWRAELPNDGAYWNLEQDAANVYVLAQGRALAFNVASGNRLWATNEFTGGALFKIFGRAAVARNGHFDLEWRDASSGEVIAVWGERGGGFASKAVMAVGNILIGTQGSGGLGDGVRLLRVPDRLKERLRPR